MKPIPPLHITDYKEPPVLALKCGFETLVPFLSLGYQIPLCDKTSLTH